jgi:hypothetical protein
VELLSSVRASMSAAPPQKGAPQGAGFSFLARVPLAKVAARMQTAKVRFLKSMLIRTILSFCGCGGVAVMMVVQISVADE